MKFRTSFLRPFTVGAKGGTGVYNRYIPEDSQYTSVDPPERHRGGDFPSREKGKLLPEKLLKLIRLEKLEPGDILLALIVLLLWKDSEDNDLLLAFGAAMLLGEDDPGKTQ